MEIDNQKQKLMKDNLKRLPMAVLQVDANDFHTILWYNDTYLEMLAYTSEQYLTEVSDYYDRIDLDDLNRAVRLAQKLGKTGDSATLEVKVFTRTKEERIWAVTLYYVGKEKSAEGISSIYCFGMDMTHDKKKNISTQIEKDPLTDILSRAETEKQIQDYILKNPDSQGCFFMIDTDDFKTINDTKGHIVGNMVLTEMAKGMKHVMRANDIVGRIGGDEFIIFMKDADAEEARKKAADLNGMFQRMFAEEKNTIAVSCSIGISLYPDNGRDFKELYSASDTALYQVKKQGKNNFVFYDEISFDEKLSSYVSKRTKTKTENMDENMAVVNYVFTTLYESKNFDLSMKEVMDIIGEQFDVSRVYVFENSEDNKTTSNTYEWCNTGVTPAINDLQNLSFQENGNYEQLFKEDSIFYCRDIDSLPSKQKNILSDQGICSTLQCAIYDDDTFIGFIGFDECTGLRIWSQKEIDLLTMMSQLISLFLQKKKSRINKNKAMNYQNILQNLDDCIFVTEKESNILIYAK